MVVKTLWDDFGKGGALKGAGVRGGVAKDAQLS